MWMSVNIEMFGFNVVFFYYLEGLRLVLYIFDESEKISVKKLMNFEMFDVLLYLNFGGFYDLVLGFIDKDDLCGICVQNYIYCFGYFGYVEFLLLVYYLLFFKELLVILWLLCFRCGDFFFLRVVMYVFLRQVRWSLYLLVLWVKVFFRYCFYLCFNVMLFDFFFGIKFRVKMRFLVYEL